MLGVTLAPATGAAVADMVTTGDRARLAGADGAGSQLLSERLRAP